MTELISDVLEMENESLWSRTESKIKRLFFIANILKLPSFAILFIALVFMMKTANYTFILVGIILMIIGLICFITSLVLFFISIIRRRNFKKIRLIMLSRNVQHLISLAINPPSSIFKSKLIRKYSILALGYLASKEAIEPLTNLINYSSPKTQKLIKDQLNQIDDFIRFYEERTVKPLIAFKPYTDRSGDFVKLFTIDHRMIQLNNGSYLFMVAFFILIEIYIVINYNIFNANFTDPNSMPFLMLFIGIIIFILELIVLATIIIVRFYKTKKYYNEKNEVALLALASKSGFGFQRYAKTTILFAIADIGTEKAIHVLRPISSDKNVEIQNSAIAALDKINVKYNLPERFAYNV